MFDFYKFVVLLLMLYQKSVLFIGKFGFYVIIYVGNLFQFVVWENSWEIFFVKIMRQVFDLEIERKGFSEEFDVFFVVLFDKVILRFFRLFESDG